MDVIGQVNSFGPVDEKCLITGWIWKSMKNNTEIPAQKCDCDSHNNAFLICSHNRNSQKKLIKIFPPLLIPLL